MVQLAKGSTTGGRYAAGLRLATAGPAVRFCRICEREHAPRWLTNSYQAFCSG
jgi:hypothetical protein